ncbi:HalOD1 output domain-containing protein [Halosimplex amylolyticum]|uniref:HalOD1 output domain-containing protein n=1 Tax=Halosimplex amylolyticum TaxID=3396616 RepID=UPI003F56D54C
MKQSPIETEATYRIDDDQSATEAVLDAVAERAGVGVLDLSVPLYEAVDPDALNAFYRACEGSASVSFSYYGYDVEVSGSGELVLTE